MVILSAFLFGCMPLITRYIYAEGINRESVVLLCILLALVISVGAVVMFERASILSTVEPLTGVLMGMVVFHEKTTLAMCIGSVLVISACILITVFDKKQAS